MNQPAEVPQLDADGICEQNTISASNQDMGK